MSTLLMLFGTLFFFFSSRRFARAFPKGLKGMAPNGPGAAKAKAILIILCVSFALHALVLAVAVSLIITQWDPRLLMGAATPLIGLALTWISIDLVRNGNEETPKRDKR